VAEAGMSKVLASPELFLAGWWISLQILYMQHVTIVDVNDHMYFGGLFLEMR